MIDYRCVMNVNRNKIVIGIVSKNITVEEFYNWSWQRIADSIRYSVNKNSGLVMGVLPQTLRKEFNREDGSVTVPDVLVPYMGCKIIK